jgi:ligand-binding sensor domain-containing protein
MPMSVAPPNVYWLCAILSLYTFQTLSAQEYDIKFHHITVDDGLPSNTINAVIRDNRGFIWIASENGIVRYDGYSFVNYRANEKNTGSISSNVTYVVLEDRQHRLWVGSEKGLDLYNRQSDTFNKHYFNGIPVRTIFQDHSSHVWIGSDNGLYRFEGDSVYFITSFSEMFNTEDVVYNTIPAITEDQHGNLWIGTSNGAYIYNRARNKFTHFRHDKNDPHSLSDNNVRKIIEDRAGRIWIATYGGGLNLYQRDTQQFKVYKHHAANPQSIAGNLITSLWADDDGMLWIGTDGEGMDVLDIETEIFHHLVHSPYNSESLNNNVIRSISSDGRGGVWIGTYTGGINFYNQNAKAFFHFKVPTRNGNSSITSFAEEPKGNLWIGTDGGGLCYYNRATKQFQNFYHKENDRNSLSDNRIISLQLDKQGVLWIGTYLGGLCRYNPHTQQFKHYTSKDGSGLGDDVIWSLLLDHKDQLWIGTNNGLNRYEATTDTFTSWNITNSNLSNNMVRCLYEDNTKRLWIGTQAGLNLLEDPYKQFTVMKSGDKAKSLSNHWIRSIQQDRKGNLWIGTFAGGLNRFDESSDAFIAYTETDGLPDNIISGILPDEHDNLWISTGRGLAYFDVSNRMFKNYNARDGLQNYQFNINAAFRNSQGEFMFGGTNGFTWFTPDVIRQVKENPYPPPVAFTALKIFNTDILPGAADSILSAPVNETRAITLAYDQSVLTFEYAALNFIQPEKNRYAYRLEGFESNWNLVDGKRSATYTNLDPGKYTFRVIASNNDGVWNEQGASIDIVILPPFWSTWWFRTIVVVLFCITIACILNVVRERIREKIRINKLIAELELKALIAQMNPHFVFNCLTSIQELIAVHKQDDAMHYLYQFSKLLRMVLQTSEKNSIPLDEELTLLELYLELESLRFDKQFHYAIDVDAAIDPEDVIIPSFLLQPFVENALWHGLMHKKGDRNLLIQFSLEDADRLVCKIHDNGIGRQQAAAIRQKRVKTYQSMGIKIIRDRITLMRKQNETFNLRIIDEKDEHGNATGTTVLVQLPVKTELHHQTIASLNDTIEAV